MAGSILAATAAAKPAVLHLDDIDMTGAAEERTDRAAAPGSAHSPEPRPSLESIRQRISEQFDIEIVLKHRELRLIEQEIGKTQIAIEQLRRCALIPYANSSEAQLLNALGLSGAGGGIPEFAPPAGVVDGPYTRHYRQWLIPHPGFDGNLVEPFVQTSQLLQQQQQLLGGGRPQRSSAMKMQSKNGEQVCLFRKKDGTLVKLQCNTCHRSNFSSAQGFINHCRIAHQTEYASHDAAAEACGHPVDENEQTLVAAPVRPPVDGPARHTRQTLQNSLAPLQTPQHMPAPTKTPYISPYVLDPSFTPTPTPTSAHPPRKVSGSGGHGRRSSVQTQLKSPAKSASKVPARPPTPPQDFSTPHLEGLLKRKRMKINIQDFVKEMTEQRVDWDRISPEGTPESDVSSNISSVAQGRLSNSVLSTSAIPTGVRSLPDLQPQNNIRDITPSRLSLSFQKPRSPTPADRDGDVEMVDDSSSSDEEDDYQSDNDDNLYSVPAPTAMASSGPPATASDHENLLSAVSRAAASLRGSSISSPSDLPPKHVRFAVPGIAGNAEHVHGVQG